MISRISSFLNVRANEGKLAALVVGIMLLGAAGFSLGGTGIEALYFARYGTSLLPYLFMGLGILSLFITLTISGLLSRVKPERMYIIIPLIATIFLVLAWGLLFSKSRFILPALWLGKEALNNIVSMIAWNTAGAVCDSRRAKRLFPLFSAARILGSVLGGLGTGLLVHLIGTQNLILLWAAAMAAVFTMTRILMKGKSNSTPTNSKSRVKRQPSSFTGEIKKGWQYVRTSSLMRLISIAAILFSVLYFSIALPFSKSATAQFPNENELAGFLGLFNALSTAAAFSLSIFFANRMFARFGIMNMLLALPIIYLVGFGTLTFFNFFAVVVAFRFIQMLWLSGIADAAYQTMFSAIPAEKRIQVNAFMNGIPEQAGVLLAGGILVIGEKAFTSQQLYLIGFVTAVATTVIIWRASSAYRAALVSSLREGRPQIFIGRGTAHDSISLNIALEHLKNPDPLIRRMSVELLGGMNSADAAITLLHDEDSDVRVAVLKGLSHHPSAELEITTLLSDPVPAVRQQAVRTLQTSSTDPQKLAGSFKPMLHDTDVHVQIEAALGLLKTISHDGARELIWMKSSNSTYDERIHALQALSEIGDREAFSLITKSLSDPSAQIRRQAALALGRCGEEAIPVLVASLADDDSSVREGVALSLAHIGKASTSKIIDALHTDAFANGALLALEYLPIDGYTNQIKASAQVRINSALTYSKYASTVPSENKRLALLTYSLQMRAKQDALRAFRALGLISDNNSVRVAIENLSSREASQRANALETLESLPMAHMVRPLLQLWEFQSETQPLDSSETEGILLKLLQESDDWLRACAAFAAQGLKSASSVLAKLALDDPSPLIRDIASKGETMDTRTTLSIMERILLLRHVSLLSDLPPSDLQRIAALASEQHAEKDETIFEQGDAGDEMYVIVHGEVKVMVLKNESEVEIARRKVGDAVGEMSIISGEPRSASLIAAEETHFLCLDKKSFEGLLRERPEVSLQIMRVLCERLKEASAQLG